MQPINGVLIFTPGYDLPLFFNLFVLYFQSVFYFQHVLIISFQPGG